MNSYFRFGWFIWSVLVAFFLGAIFLQESVWAQQLAGPGWSPIIIPSGQYRQQIKSLPIEQRPYRPLHFYGNSIRRSYYRGTSFSQAASRQAFSRGSAFGATTIRNTRIPASVDRSTEHLPPIYRPHSAFRTSDSAPQVFSGSTSSKTSFSRSNSGTSVWSAQPWQGVGVGVPVLWESPISSSTINKDRLEFNPGQSGGTSRRRPIVLQ